MEEILTRSLSAVAEALIVLASAFLIYYMNKATERIKAETLKVKDERQRKLLEDAVTRVNDLCVKAVANTEQTIAGELRLAVKDGKVEVGELKALGDKAKSEVYGQLTTDTKALLELEINDVQKYIEHTIETALLDLKNK